MESQFILNALGGGSGDDGRGYVRSLRESVMGWVGSAGSGGPDRPDGTSRQVPTELKGRRGLMVGGLVMRLTKGYVAGVNAPRDGPSMINPCTF